MNITLNRTDGRLFILCRCWCAVARCAKHLECACVHVYEQMRTLFFRCAYLLTYSWHHILSYNFPTHPTGCWPITNAPPAVRTVGVHIRTNIIFIHHFIWCGLDWILLHFSAPHSHSDSCFVAIQIPSISFPLIPRLTIQLCARVCVLTRKVVAIWLAFLGILR